jgi:hypothetical protein
LALLHWGCHRSENWPRPGAGDESRLYCVRLCAPHLGQVHAQPLRKWRQNHEKKKNLRRKFFQGRKDLLFFV